MTSLLSECGHERDELCARVRELERERDEAQHRYERALEALAESSAAAAREQARLREALVECSEKLAEAMMLEGRHNVRCTSWECGACTQCTGTATVKRARAALAGEEGTP